MQAFGDIAKPPKFKSKVVKEGLKCENVVAPMTTTNLKSKISIQKVRFGCDCEMQELARQSTENYHKNNDVSKLKRYLNNLLLINH